MPIFSRYTLEPASWLEKIRDPVRTDTRKKVLSWMLVFASYVLTAQIGGYLYRDIGTSPALIWPPVGIALAAVLIEGYWIASAIAAGAFLNALLNEAPLFILMGSVLANTIQPLAGGFVLRALRFNPLMNTLRDVFMIISVSFIATIIMPLINYGFAILYNLLYSASRPLPPWPALWVGGCLSALILTPFLARWIGRDITARTRLQQLEVLLSLFALSSVSYLIFCTPYMQGFGTPLLLALIATLFWIAFRVGPRVMSLGLLIMTSISLAGVIYGIHPPSDQTLSERLIATEVFDLIFAFFFFILVCVEEQRKEAMRILNNDATRLENALETIRSEDKAKNDFIATLAHELRNPLAPVMSGLELLSMSEKDPEKSEIIESARRQSVIMRRLLDELLDVARVARKTFALHKEDVLIQNILKQSIQATEHFFKERKHTFTSEIASEELWVSADSVRLAQVFTNILFNAGKYTEPNGTIHLKLHKDTDFAHVEIRDSGIGISENMLTRIFEPFVQDNRQTSQAGGLGIGLSIAKRMVELHEGSIAAESEGESRGSVFKIRLPLISTRTAKPIVSSSPLSSPLAILVVDDNQDAASAISRLLRHRGHTVNVAHNGKDALKALTKKTAVVLLDVGLPDIHGHEVAMAMRKKNPDCLIIALSGYGSKDDKRRAHEAAMDAHITKPASLADIEVALSRLMNKTAT